MLSDVLSSQKLAALIVIAGIVWMVTGHGCPLSSAVQSRSTTGVRRG